MSNPIQTLLDSAGAFPNSTAARWLGLDARRVAQALVARGEQGANQLGQVFSWAGDPNGHVYVPNTDMAICIDTVNQIAWVKSGTIGSSGWQQGFSISENFPTSVNDGDPLVPSMIINGVQYGNVSYVLSGTYNKGSGPVLTIQYPSTYFDQQTAVPGTGPGSGGMRWPVYWLRIQRGSINTNGFPGDFDIGEYPFWAPVYLSQADALAATVSYPADPKWTTVAEFTGASYTYVDQLPTTWPDTVEPTTMNAYRVYMAMGPLHIGSDWINVILGWNVIGWTAYQTITVTSAGGANVNINFTVPTITWDLPL